MSYWDLANACFEGCAAAFILNHCRVLYKDKKLRGVSVLSVAFFFSWGVFNIGYYWAIAQTFSWYAGIAVCLSNLLWITMMLYYRHKETGGPDWRILGSAKEKLMEAAKNEYFIDLGYDPIRDVPFRRSEDDKYVYRRDGV